MKEPFARFVESKLGSGVLLITCGLPGTWKSETSEEISRIRGYPILRSDLIRLEVLKGENIFDEKVASNMNKATAKVLNLSPEQSQFLDTRRFSVLELCALWKVPPEMLGIGAEGSGAVLYQNLERVKLRFVQQALLAPLMLIESTFSKFLPRSQRIRFNTDAYLRADTTVRYNAHAVALGAGFLTIDEVRQLEDLPPMPEQPTPSPSMPDAGSESESEEGDDDATD